MMYEEALRTLEELRSQMKNLSLDYLHNLKDEICGLKEEVTELIIKLEEEDLYHDDADTPYWQR